MLLPSIFVKSTETVVPFIERETESAAELMASDPENPYVVTCFDAAATLPDNDDNGPWLRKLSTSALFTSVLFSGFKDPAVTLAENFTADVLVGILN